MRTAKFSIVIVFISLMALMIMSCVGKGMTTGTSAVDVNKRAYQILQASQSTYSLVISGVRDLYTQKAISKQDYLEIKKYADMYADAHNAAITAMAAYNRGKASYSEASATLPAVAAALTELLKAAQPYLLKLEG